MRSYEDQKLFLALTRSIFQLSVAVSMQSDAMPESDEKIKIIAEMETFMENINHVLAVIDIGQK